MPTERLHICGTDKPSGIADYAIDFQRSILGPEGYALTGPDEIRHRERALSLDTCIHVQLGVFQQAERVAMTRLMNRGFRNVDATVHDPPFLTFPYFGFSSRLMQRLSRGFDWYLGSFGLQRRDLERLSRIFVLSERGGDALLRLAPDANVISIPHFIPREKIWPTSALLERALIYFGFIGPGKGLDYVLEVHRALQRKRPGTHLHVVGRPLDAAGRRYLAGLQNRYRDDVTFHGYVPAEGLDALFQRAGHVVLPFAAYKYVMPSSASMINALRRGRIVWTTNVNAMSEVVRDGENGFMLSMDAEKDALRMAHVMEDDGISRRISDAARASALTMADYPYWQHFRENAA